MIMKLRKSDLRKMMNMGLVNDRIKLQVLEGMKVMGTKLGNCIHADLKVCSVIGVTTDSRHAF